MKRIKSSIRCFKLTRKIAGRFVSDGDIYRFNGTKRPMVGEHVLSMMMSCVLQDEYSLHRLTNPKVIIDVGANVGVFAVHAATLYPDVEIHAFEPDLENFRKLKLNTSGLNVVCHHKGVARKSGTMHILASPNPTSIRLTEVKNNSDANHTIIEVMSLLDVVEMVAPNGKVSFLKLDCEGAEYDILESPALSRVDTLSGELHTTDTKTPEDGLSMIKHSQLRLLNWSPFPDGKAGIVLASQDRQFK